ncbi:hypothetical protein A4A49_60519, partial [Nicotiana attenuata]
HKPARVEFGRFKGEGPAAWVFQAEHYFDFCGIEANHQLSLASFYLDGEALEWHLLGPVGRLSKLQQTTSVADFQARFESIANETEDLTESVLKGPVRPAFARTQPLLPTPSFIPNNPINQNSKSLMPSAPPYTPHRIPVKRLTPAELHSCRERGLCYHCDEKYSSTHKCKNFPQLLLLADESDIPLHFPESYNSDELLAEELQCLEIHEHSAISYHALVGGNSPTTLHFTGHINGSPVQVLKDDDSTHNFIQTRVAKFLQLSVEPITPFSVVVGSGQRLRCKGVSRQVTLTVQGCNIVADFYVLPLHGSDLVLGVSWLAPLGRVVTDYGARIFEFNYNGNQYCWNGEGPPTDAQPVHLYSLRRLAATDAVASYYCLIAESPDLESTTSPAMEELLSSFADVFQKP